MRNQPHHLPRWIVLPLPLTPRWLAPIHSDAEPLSGRQQVADAGGSASPTVRSASNRETCLASQRSRPAGVRTPRASSSWAIAASASVNEPGTRKALPSSPLGPSPPPLSVSGWENGAAGQTRRLRSRMPEPRIYRTWRNDIVVACGISRATAPWWFGEAVSIARSVRAGLRLIRIFRDHQYAQRGVRGADRGRRILVDDPLYQGG